MNSWRDQILNEFTPNVAKLTLAADPDGLLLEEGILEGVRDRGFELIPFEDHIAFRYAYESKFRSRWDRGEHTDLVVVLRSQASDLNGLPFDLLQAGRKLSFNLGDIFPNLSYPVVTALETGDLDALYGAQQRHAPGQLGDNATKEFVLRHVFEIAPELIKQPSDLLRVLLRRHYRGRRIPDALDARFIQILRQNKVFDEWPLEIIVSDREAFFAFLQERWPVFLDQASAGAGKDIEPCNLSMDGPVDLPFDHDDIRVYIDNLFIEGLLQPVPHAAADSLKDSWVHIGVQDASREDQLLRLDKLIANLNSSLPSEEARHTEWFRFARGWAELILLFHEMSGSDHEDAFQKVQSLRDQLDERFTGWLLKRYAGLVNLPPAPPVMLHHMPRFLARQVEDDAVKVAMVVVDGLAMDQWLVIRNILNKKYPGLRFREQSVFAWVPTLTSVSRQAAFAGKAPAFFPNSIMTTNKEPALWAQFWADQRLSQQEVIFMKGLGDGDVENVAEALSHPKAKVAGLVVDKVDKIMHGMEMGTAGMHNQVRQWAEQPYLHSLFELLQDKGYRIFLTSDHGNIEAAGCGRPKEGGVADLRGERVRIYPGAILRDQVKERFPDALEWGSAGLPENYFALIAPARRAFINEKISIVGHGGVSIEEIIVPLIQIEKESMNAL
ncbi:PglZ domain-containing protein [Desulfatibacillum alkenivorans DSM 16219]|uniref:PglZ domain-containing protein n=1 Tax=Desulfatibacillum alkenivorans DSM 16219 TaxID=1121393 RepID=A0A1M6YM47_9BACT|nr:BREX-3 system phosphatase PglZ [Desulfatibacillum alkenivorans]SHL19190.1 PglZ domain-containing protein [Desulfatibacillum alkenivorans DSM 16219]